MINEEHNVKCPYCSKDLPAEIDFCPYCMERLTPARELTLLSTHRNKKKAPTIALILIVFVICFAIVGVSLKNNIDKSNNSQNKDFANNTTEAPKITNTNISETPAKEPETSKTPVSSTETTVHTTQTNSPVTESPNSATQTNIEADIVSRWNRANNDLYIYNFILNDYTVKQGKEQLCISQSFNNSGAYIDFNVKNDLQSYTLKIDKITNLNTMYQLCRVSFLTVAQEKYSDTEFSNFISDDNWKIDSAKEEIKTGVLDGYACKVILTQINEPGSGGLDYTYYTCLLTVDKVTPHQQ